MTGVWHIVALPLRAGGALVRDAKLLFGAARQRREISKAQRLVWRMIADGGVVIRTPSDAPLVSTSIQLDGDAVTIVNDRAFDRTQEELRALAASHRTE